MLAVGLVFATLAGCDSADDGNTRAEPAGQPADRQERTATTDETGNAARGGPVRLLRLGQFDTPTYLTAPRGDRRRFVVQRGGTIVIVRGGRQLDRPFLDISGDISTDGEGGLLSMAFAPDYDSSGRFYVYYTDRQGYLQIDQFRRSRNPDRARASSRRSVIRVPHFRPNHKGGQLQFGPDGMLYAGFGDGGGGGDPDENAQNLGRILGKLIRIDPRPGGGYRVPASNPFVRRRGAVREIYAYGLRNPYRFSFDRDRGSLTIGDVGQDAVEEIDYVPVSGAGPQPRGGYNFGWDVFEGRSHYESGSARRHVPPVIAHPQSDGFCSIIGGYVIRDRSLRGSRYAGRYVYGDLCSPDLRLAFLKRPRAPTRPSGLSVPNLVSFGEDGFGRVYAVSIAGPIYRIGRR
jgi:glucose/arabinose dehydrogenase